MPTSRGARRALLVVIAFFGASLVGVSTAAAATAHCADHTTATKVEAEDSPATVQVPDTTTGDLIWVTVTITGTGFTIEPVDPSVTLTDASWCVKSSTKTNSGSGTSGQSESFNKNGQRQAISYVVVYSVASEPYGPPPAECDEATNSGGEGVTTTVHELGVAGPTSFQFDFEAYAVPDRFQVFYEGAEVFDSGYVGTDTGGPSGGSTTVTLPAGSSTQVTVVVTGDPGTVWDYIVYCPENGGPTS